MGLCSDGAAPGALTPLPEPAPVASEVRIRFVGGACSDAGPFAGAMSIEWQP
jgi:hypothetical protein